MIRHLCIRAGDWMLQNWHLYRKSMTGNRRGDVRWEEWRCFFCRRALHQIESSKDSSDG